jgi:DNA-binding response OmpR family regulator
MGNGVRQRVLVVEDEPTINQAVADRLVAEGFEVRQAYDECRPTVHCRC